MELEDFYTRCAELLNTTHEFSAPTRAVSYPHHSGGIRNITKTRWNFRHPGNGRFPGHGLVRAFGENVQVNLYDPVLVGQYESRQAALDAIAVAAGLSHWGDW